jgi:predicted PurR-regulated permease PerM
MPYTKNSLYFLYIFLAVALVLAYFVIKPFLSPLILAAVFAFLFQPWYKRLLKKFRNRPSLAALATMIITTVIVMIPLSFLGVQIFKESSQLYSTLAAGGQNGFLAIIQNLINQVQLLFPISSDFHINLSQYLQRGLEALIGNIGSIFSSVAGIILNFFVFLIAFYFLLKDGSRLKDYFILLSPLSDVDDQMVVSRLSTAVSSVVKGNLSIGLIQGVLTGIGCTIFGVPNPVLWGTMAAITALIHGVGTALVVIPAVIFLYIMGNTFGSLGLLIWGVTAVGLIDNLLGPRLVGRGMKMHPLMVFLSVLGGLALFGPLGFLLGPLVMSLCLALIEIATYKKEE